MVVLMKYVVFSLTLLYSSACHAKAGNTYVETLLNICTIAQKTGDTGTIKNIANQIKNEQMPSDDLLAKRFNECLTAAFGKTDNSNNVSDLLKRIDDTEKKLKADCNNLLIEAPQVAIAHSICKEILVK